jgi:hypothetical protein
MREYDSKYDEKAFTLREGLTVYPILLRISV